MARSNIAGSGGVTDNLRMDPRRIAFGVGFLLLANAMFALRAAAQLTSPQPKEQRACWTNIHYAPLPIPSTRGQWCSVSVRSNLGSGPEGRKPSLEVVVTWSDRDFEPIPEAMTKPERMSVRMHFPNGNVVEAQNRFRVEGITTEAGKRSASRIAQFPWGPNVLEEAWFELKIDEVPYWLEMPYGLSRDPLAPLPPAEPKAGPGKVAPAMAKLRTSDRVACWWKVELDLGVIQKDWHLQMVAANDGKRNWIATLSGESGPWSSLGTDIRPRIVDEDGAGVEATHAGSQYWGNSRLKLEYRLSKYQKDGRSWGTLMANVNGYSWGVVIPSSLFKSGHAAAGRDHWQSVPLPSLW